MGTEVTGRTVTAGAAPCAARVGPCPVAKCAAPPSPDCREVEELVGVSGGGCCPRLCNFKAADGVSECAATPAPSRASTVTGHNYIGP